MSIAPHLLLRVPTGVILAGLAGWAWLAPKSAQAANSPTAPLPPAVMDSHVVVEARSLGTSIDTYGVVKAGRQPTPSPNGCTLLIYFPQTTLGGNFSLPSGADAQNGPHQFSPWTELVSAHPEVVVAAPGQHSALVPIDMVTEIIDDTVAHDHVNPKHVFLVGYAEGAMTIGQLAGAQPKLFAGMAVITPDARFFSIDMLNNAAGLPLYMAVGNQAVDDQHFEDGIKRLKAFGFNKIGTFRPDSGPWLTMPMFEQMNEDMLKFFDRELSANEAQEKKEADIQTKLAKSLVGVVRTLAQPQGTYFLLTHDPKKFPSTKAPTLLICLYGQNDTAHQFAGNWVDLVKSHPDLEVAVPVAADGTAENPWGSGTADLITAVIADAEARDHVNPKQVFLVGTGAGAEAGGRIVGESPDQFAGFADIGPAFPDALFTPALKANAARLGIYYANTTPDHAIAISPHVYEQLKEFGFNFSTLANRFEPTNLLVEVCDVNGTISPDQFKFRITRLMRFFDGVLARNANPKSPTSSGLYVESSAEKNAAIMNLPQSNSASPSQ